ncbi:MAG TPA: hypothetical protein VKU19_31755 [Bryobacteraceae bacterium]|nr:hypothetical protein [Bryobacteraceae bacterium]
MRIKRFGGSGVLVLAFASAGLAASVPNAPDVTAQMVITVSPSQNRGQSTNLGKGDVTLFENKTVVPVVGLQRMTGDLGAMQLFVLLDDSTRSSSLGTQLPTLKKFIASLPSTTQVAVGYMHNGTFALSQSFTTDHEKASSMVRLPVSLPGENGSPYFVLSDLAKHWPSKEPTGRRAVLMCTDGVDRYYSSSIVDDPYVDAAKHDALKAGIMVYAVYLRGAGLYGRGGWLTTIAQSRLSEVSQETGGYAYFEGVADPVTISPFLQDLQERFDNQYQLTFKPLSEKGIQPVKLKPEFPGLKVYGPEHIYVR